MSKNLTEEDQLKKQSDELWALEKKKEALQLRITGHSDEEIADVFGVEQSVVEKWIRQGLRKARKINSELGETVIDLEMARLDRMLIGLEVGVGLGDSNAISSALRIQERRSKLLGLDKPVKIAPTSPDGEKEYTTIDTSKLTMDQLIALKESIIVSPEQD